MSAAGNIHVYHKDTHTTLTTPPPPPNVHKHSILRLFPLQKTVPVADIEWAPKHRARTREMSLGN